MPRPLRPLLAVLAAALVGGAGAAPAARAADPRETLGVYVGPNDGPGVHAYEAWLGRPVHRVLDFLADEDWSKIATPWWWMDGWSQGPWRDKLVYSVPLIPDSGGSLAAGARGDYDHHFRTLARHLVARGQGGVVIRPGWEFNGGWYAWRAAAGPDDYVAYFRNVVRAMRSVDGARFRFDWSPVIGEQQVAPDRAYPGDDVVDLIGLDVYDQDWGPGWQDPDARWQHYLDQPYGLRWHRDFARAHGKPMTFPEWGVIDRDDGHGGGDEPSFVRRMHDWIAANDVAYHVYFEYDGPGSRIALMPGTFPRSAALFKDLFGAARRPAPPARTAPPAPAAPPDPCAPATPAPPAVPAAPGRPATPGTPATPAIPATPAGPGLPAVPATPPAPARPAPTATPAAPARSGAAPAPPAAPSAPAAPPALAPASSATAATPVPAVTALTRRVPAGPVARGRPVTVRVRARHAGRIEATLVARRRGAGPVAVARGRRTVRRAGTVRLTLRPTARHRSAAQAGLTLRLALRPAAPVSAAASSC